VRLAPDFTTIADFRKNNGEGFRKGSGIVGYNLLANVDAKHPLIVAHEVTNVGNDRSALYRTATLAKNVIGSDALDVVTDRGFYSCFEMYHCEQSQIKPIFPTHIPRTTW
jgi:hypothetical protein